MADPSCPVPATVGHVEVERLVRPDGLSDQNVVVYRAGCGHPYFWGGPLLAPLPAPGDRAASCLGPQVGSFTEVRGALPPEPVIFDERKRPMRKVAIRDRKPRQATA